MFKDILYQRDSMRPLASNKESAEFDEELDSEVVIIHAQDDLIEKNLGLDETMIVACSSLVAFEDGVLFSAVPTKSIVSFERSKFVRVHGPGMIYVETSREQKHGLTQIFKA
mmetsp:Transcript_13993/g.19085  ORF Transcript_13993/g.19085 Transcript_13993/m.19085 type:complete len:112 (-) Transcript_13993:177-512(-)